MPQLDVGTIFKAHFTCIGFISCYVIITEKDVGGRPAVALLKHILLRPILESD